MWEFKGSKRDTVWRRIFERWSISSCHQSIQIFWQRRELFNSGCILLTMRTWGGKGLCTVFNSKYDLTILLYRQGFFAHLMELFLLYLSRPKILITESLELPDLGARLASSGLTNEIAFHKLLSLSLSGRIFYLQRESCETFQIDWGLLT